MTPKYAHHMIVKPNHTPNGYGRPYPPNVPESADNAINLGEIWNTIRQGKWVILATCVVVTAAVAVYTFLAPPTYQANSIVSVSTGGALVPGVMSGVEERSLTTELGILRNSGELSQRVAERLAETASAMGTKEYFPILSSKEEEEAPAVHVVAKRLRDRVRFNSYLDANMVGITAESSVPEEAARIANLYAEEYEQFAQENSRASLVAAREFLEKQVDQRLDELGELEDQWKRFAQNRQTVTQGQTGERVVAGYMDLVSRKENVEFQLEKEQMDRELLKGELERVEPGLVSNVTSDLDKEIAGLDEKITALKMEAEDYYAVTPSLRGNEEREPELQEIIKRKESFERRREDLARQLISETLGSGATGDEQLGYAAQIRTSLYEKDLNIRRLQAEIDAYNQRIDAHESRLGGIPDQTIEIEQLERRRGIVEQWYNRFVEELQKIQVAEQSDLGYVDVVRMAVVPTLPVRPDPVKNIMLALLVGLILGIGFTFVRAALHQRLQKPEDLRHLGYNLVGVIPPMQQEIRSSFKGQEAIEVEGKMLSTRLITLLNPWSTIAENYRLVRTNIQMNGAGEVPQVLLVTSPEASDGKTVNSVNLAIAMAQSERRTLLIDADLRRPSAHKLLGMDNSLGLAEMLQFEWEAMPSPNQLATDIENLHFISAGKVKTPPPELLGSGRMQRLLKHFRKEFDLIIIDSPPVLVATDAVLLSSLCDATIVVVSANRTESNALNAVRSMLESVGVPVTGIILNRFDGKRAGGNYYGYGYGYGYTYEYDQLPS